jgi:site-specific DNA recombinase
MVQRQAAYRCRHGHTTATRPEPGRPKNTYIREDQILPHLAAVAILLSRDQVLSGHAIQLTSPDEAAALIGQLRTAGITLPYDPNTRTIRTSDRGITAVAVS